LADALNRYNKQSPRSSELCVWSVSWFALVSKGSVPLCDRPALRDRMDFVSPHSRHCTRAVTQSACPPIAKRPHFQDGFLLGASPLNSLTQDDCDRSRLTRRLVAKFELHDAGDFWDCDFPVIRKGALMPTEDRLLDRLYHYFGPSGTKPVRTIAEGSFGEVRRTAG
jgi:hypothetical protein